jgi:hypothetical protein
MMRSSDAMLLDRSGLQIRITSLQLDDASIGFIERLQKANMGKALTLPIISPLPRGASRLLPHYLIHDKDFV